PSTNNCQDLGNSILSLLDLIRICVNTGVNTVTLVRPWRRLRSFLHQVFRVICEKEASELCSPGKQTQPPKQSAPAVDLRCTMDPVKMTVLPPPTRHCRHRDSSAHCAHRHVAWAPDTDSDDEKTPRQHTTICSHNWDCPKDWEGFQSTQGFWTPWAQAAVEPPTQTIRFQQTAEGRPLKREMQSELGLEAYAYPPSGPEPQERSVVPQAEQEQCSPAQPPMLGSAHIPDIPQHHSSGHVACNARDVRGWLRELTREVEALSHCYSPVSGSSTAEGTGKAWVYRSLTER
ncbi:hypothetical protein EI555_010422, partial [Monodon monoceros]